MSLNTHPELSVDKMICQYMDLDYLIHMLATGRYFVRQKCGFPDERESALPPQKMFHVHLASTKTPEEILKAEAEERKQIIHMFKEHKSALTSCWTASKPDNYLMWKSYTSKMGVCIISSIGDFCESLSQNEIKILCGPIKYARHSVYDDFTTRMFKKEAGYASENEIRFYIGVKDFEAPNANGGIYLNVDCKRLIHKAILSPLIESAAARQICEWINTHFGISIAPSSLRTKR